MPDRPPPRNVTGQTMLECPRCLCVVAQDRMLAHRRRVHGTEAERLPVPPATRRPATVRP